MAEYTLEQQVAQRLMVGYTGTRPGSVTERLIQHGLGGLLFFRENFNTLDSPGAVAELLQGLRQQWGTEFPRPFFGIDQEGGQVERLPFTLFPSMVNPMALALAENGTPKELSAEVYDMLGFYLSLLGFNLNFFPTLDVNINPQNPIIGVRAFSDNPETVWAFAKVAMEKLDDRGVVPVGKHFPGHGNGTVDSHLSLPILETSPEERSPFLEAIQHRIPALMVAHGFYPALQTDTGEANCPASASQTIVQQLLRTDLGFEGVVFSDDLCMGAVATESSDPIQVAIHTLNAGVDVLVYRESTETQWIVFEGICQALRSGTLSIAEHQKSLQRIFTLKASLKNRTQQPERINLLLSPQAVTTTADYFATKTLTILSPEPANLLPLDPEKVGWLIFPDRAALHNYAPDQKNSLELPEYFEALGFEKIDHFSYLPQTPLNLPESVDTPPDWILIVTFNPQQDPQQQDTFQQLQKNYPNSKIMIASVGIPVTEAVLPGAQLYMAMGSYRPAAIKALVELLLEYSPPQKA